MDCRVSGCGKGAHCVLVDSDYSCQCPPGTVGNPNKDCIPGKIFIFSLDFFRSLYNFLSTHPNSIIIINHYFSCLNGDELK